MPKLSLLARAAVALALIAATPGAEAEERAACAARDKVIKRLSEQFGETLKSLGVHKDDAVIEVYSSDDTGTWTILVTRTDGISCLLAAGQRWEQDVTPIRAPGDDA